MKSTFLMLIFSPYMDQHKKQQAAKDAGYTMYLHNGRVYSASDNSLLFGLNELIKDK